MATYDIGDTVRCSGTFSVGGVATDPTTIVFKLKTPAGTLTTYTYGVDLQLVRDGVGQYHVDVLPTTPFTWTYRFEGAGAVKAAYESTFTVVSSAFY